MTTAPTLIFPRRPLKATELEVARSLTIDALRACAQEYGQEHLTTSQYDAWRAEQLRQGVDPAPPSRPTIRSRFGGFVAALDAAGLKPRPRQALGSQRLEYVNEPTGLRADEELAVAYAFSLFLGTRRGERLSAYQLCRIFGALAGVDGPGREGGWPVGSSVFRWLEMTPAQLDAHWALVETSERLLPSPIVKAFFPPRIWAQTYASIAAGPLTAWESVRTFLRAWALGLEPTGEPRSTAGANSTLDDRRLSEGALAVLHKALFTFMDTLDRVRVAEEAGKLTLPYECRFFAAWTTADFPRRPLPGELGAAPAETIREAASLRLVRLVLQILCEEIERLGKTAAGRRRLFQPLRDRAIVATLVITGLRRQAFNRLSIGDVKERFLFPDGEIGPALVPRPGKSLSQHLKRPKGIPAQLLDWIKEYTEHAGTWGEEDAPLWLPNDEADQALRNPMSDNSIYEAVRARFTPKVGAAAETRPLYRAFLEEHDGRIYGTHNLRHTAEQLGTMAGFDWFEANRNTITERKGGAPANPQIFPDTLLDHSMTGMGDLYKDIASERGRSIWARRCALGIAEYAFGDKGARRGPDLALIAEKQRVLDDANSRKAEVEEQLQAIEVRIASGGTALNDKVILLGIFQTLQLTGQLGDLAAAVERARHDLTEARLLDVPVADTLTTAELNDLRAHRNASLADRPDNDGGDEDVPMLRDWAWLQEFHWALGGNEAVSLETLRRWARGEHTRLARALGLPAGVPGINGGRPACIEKLSDRKQKINLRALNWSHLPTQVRENLEAIQHMPWDGKLSSMPVEFAA